MSSEGQLSKTYVPPDFEPPPDWPRPRRPGAVIRVVPNETVWCGDLRKALGELVLDFAEVGADFGVEVALDTSDRTRPGEQRAGGSPIEVISLLLVGLAGREAVRLSDQCVDAAVAWIRRRKRFDDPESVVVTLYGPTGEVLRRVEVRGEYEAELVLVDDAK